MSTPTCSKCYRLIREGESAWADEWKVIDVSGTTAAFRIETRYTCDECEAVA